MLYIYIYTMGGGASNATAKTVAHTFQVIFDKYQTFGKYPILSLAKYIFV